MPLPRGQHTARLFKIKPYPDLLALRQIYTAKSISWFRTVVRYSPITSFILPLSVKKRSFLAPESGLFQLWQPFTGQISVINQEK